MEISSIIGFLALFIGSISLILKKDSHLLFGMSASNFLMGFHYLLLGHIVGAYTLFFDGVKNVIAPKYRGNLGVCIFLVISTCGVGYFGYSGVYTDIFPVFASSLWTGITFFLQGLKMRFLIIFVGLSWICYNIVVGSTPGLIMSLIFFVSNLVGIFMILYVGKTPKNS